MTEQSLKAPEAVADGGDERLRRTPLIRQLLTRPEMGAVSGFIVVLVFFAFVASGTGMFSPRGVMNFLEVSALLGILAIGVSLLMIGGEFDLTVGSMIAFSGMTMALASVVFGLPIWLAILLAFAVALGAGFVNGWVVVKTGLPSFIVTLGGLFMFRGLTIGITRLVTGRTQVSGVHAAAEDDPLAPFLSGSVGRPVFEWLAEAGVIATRIDGLPVVSGVPVSVVWFLILGGLATWVLLRTRFGNWIFAVGGDKVAARNVGVPVTMVKITLFMVTAGCAALVAMIQVLDAGSADTQRGLLRELEAIAAAVIGGCLLTGGYGSAIGAMFGALIFGTVQMGIFYSGIDTDWFQVFLGAMILIAVLSNNYIRRKAMEGR